jgi:hypothetical protein
MIYNGNKENRARVKNITLIPFGDARIDLRQFGMVSIPIIF